eukprot:14017172-Ditylum_brightwellii.AAC.1
MMQCYNTREGEEKKRGGNSGREREEEEWMGRDEKRGGREKREEQREEVRGIRRRSEGDERTVHGKLYVNRGLCPGIHAAPAATKGLAPQPKPQMMPSQRGSPPKPEVALPLCFLLHHTGFWRGRVSAGITHRQGKHNM